MAPSSWDPSGRVGLTSPRQLGSCGVSRGRGLGLFSPGWRLGSPTSSTWADRLVGTPACCPPCSWTGLYVAVGIFLNPHLWAPASDLVPGGEQRAEQTPVLQEQALLRHRRE